MEAEGGFPLKIGGAGCSKVRWEEQAPVCWECQFYNYIKGKGKGKSKGKGKGKGSYTEDSI